MPTLAIELPRETLAAFCEKWQIHELAVFGSALRPDFRPDSDLDLLVTFEAGARLSLWDIIAAEQELAELLGRPVDLVEKCAVENSENWIRKHHILQSAHVVYAR